eukprot:TRINITY_DN11878_c0_g1_i1.p1 TRINITY_DN11878_c0_g1~~TRINITY_DN11878_c0_g1_i1.p1  ORF type:complete len:372 (+),score=86.66 TRINITY_DN11878_c0_g1_i1:123-1238(+)
MSSSSSSSSTGVLPEKDELLQKYAAQWKAEQEQITKKLILEDNFSWTLDPKKVDEGKKVTALRLVGGVDISFVPDSNVAVAALVSMSFPELKVVYSAYDVFELKVPYIAGYLAFREVQPLLTLIKHLKEKSPSLVPEVILVDGNGLLHYRGCGLACHLGYLADIPCVGVAKKLLAVDGLTRENVEEQCSKTLRSGGDTLELKGDSGRVWGVAMRATDDCGHPLFISPGHRISLQTSIELVRRCCRFRIPEPIRFADLSSRDRIRKYVMEQQPLISSVTIASQQTKHKIKQKRQLKGTDRSNHKQFQIKPSCASSGSLSTSSTSTLQSSALSTSTHSVDNSNSRNSLVSSSSSLSSTSSSTTAAPCKRKTDS